MKRILAAATLLLGVVTAGASRAQPARQPVRQPARQLDIYDLRAGAWDASVRLEQQGELAQARDMLLRAWGPTPQGYEVAVRLAWLSLRLGDSDRAIAWYRLAGTREGAGPECTRGLASAYTQRGFAALERGERPAARDDFHTAIAFDRGQADAWRGLEIAGPSSRVDPELWLGFLGQSVPGSKWQAVDLFAHVPWQIDDHWRLRLAYRYIDTRVETQPPQPTMMRPPRPPPETSTHYDQHEVYGGVGYRSRWVDLEAMGLAVSAYDEDTVLGGGYRLRLGTHFGALIESATIHREEGWNIQAIPGIYAWPGDSFGLAAGVRHTSDATGDDTSGWAGMSVLGDRSALYVRAHLGTERWAFAISEPSILTIDPDVTAGAKTTVLLPLGRTWQLGLQADIEKLRLDEQSGTYFGLGLGLRWSPSLAER